MKLTPLVFALILFGCSPSEDQRAHDTAEKAKVDAQHALHQAGVEAKKAGKEIDKGLHETREKVRKALDEPSDKKSDR